MARHRRICAWAELERLAILHLHDPRAAGDDDILTGGVPVPGDAAASRQLDDHDRWPAPGIAANWRYGSAARHDRYRSELRHLRIERDCVRLSGAHGWRTAHGYRGAERNEQSAHSNRPHIHGSFLAMSAQRVTPKGAAPAGGLW